MKRLFIIQLLILLLISPGFASGEAHTIEKKTVRFNVSKGENINVSIQNGDIAVTSWDKNEVTITYDENEDHPGVSISQKGNTITVRTSGFSSSGIYDIYVPSEFNLNLKTQAGKISISGNLKGKIEGTTAGGDITLQTISGEITMKTMGGSIFAGNLKGNVKLSSMGGSIQTGNIDGDLNISTMGGNVTAGNVNGDVKISSGGGNIVMGDGKTVNITTGGGNISTGRVKGNTQVKTGGGNIFVAESGGIISSSGNGNIEILNIASVCNITTGSGDIKAEIVSSLDEQGKISTGFGNIMVYVSDNAKLTIEARVRGSVWLKDDKDVSKDLFSVFKAEKFWNKKSEIGGIYHINGGGKLLSVQTNSGKIVLKRLSK